MDFPCWEMESSFFTAYLSSVKSVECQILKDFKFEITLLRNKAF